VQNNIPSSQSYEMAVLDTGGGDVGEDQAPLLPPSSSSSPPPPEPEPEAKGYWLWALTLSAGISGLLFGCRMHYIFPAPVWSECAGFG